MNNMDNKGIERSVKIALAISMVALVVVVASIMSNLISIHHQFQSSSFKTDEKEAASYKVESIYAVKADESEVIFVRDNGKLLSVKNPQMSVLNLLNDFEIFDSSKLGEYVNSTNNAPYIRVGKSDARFNLDDVTLVIKDGTVDRVQKEQKCSNMVTTKS